MNGANGYIIRKLTKDGLLALLFVFAVAGMVFGQADVTVRSEYCAWAA